MEQRVIHLAQRLDAVEALLRKHGQWIDEQQQPLEPARKVPRKTAVSSGGSILMVRATAPVVFPVRGAGSDSGSLSASVSNSITRPLSKPAAAIDNSAQDMQLRHILDRS